MVQKAIHAILSRFKDAFHVYQAALGEEMLAEDVGPAHLAAGLPRVRARVIGARADRAASPTALLTRWAPYQIATEVLTHHAGPRVGPERAWGFGRVPAVALHARAELPEKNLSSQGPWQDDVGVRSRCVRTNCRTGSREAPGSSHRGGYCRSCRGRRFSGRLPLRSAAKRKIQCSRG